MDGIIHRVLTALNYAGISAVRRLPDTVFPRLTSPRAAVSLERVETEHGGFYQYLGVEEAPDRGIVERYGRRMSATLLVRVFAKDSSDTAQAVCQVLSGGVQGVTVGEISVSGPKFDSTADCYVTEIRGELSAYLIAECASDEETFLDFKLEGEVK